MYSSFASLIGNPGQANIPDTNAFLDALCHCHCSLAIPGLAEVLGPCPENLDVEQPLNQLGLDSLMKVELIAQIQTESELEVSPMKFVEDNNLSGLSMYILDELVGNGKDLEGAIE